MRELHVIPADDHEHDESESCWCNPGVDERVELSLLAERVYTHRSAVVTSTESGYDADER